MESNPPRKESKQSFSINQAIDDIVGAFIKKKGSSEEKPKLRLMKDEKLKKVLHPHPLSFYDMYFVWVYVILISLLFIVTGEQISEFLGNPMGYVLEIFVGSSGEVDNSLLTGNVKDMFSSIHEQAGEVSTFVTEYSPVCLWITLLVAVSIGFSVMKISFKWIAILFGVGVVSMGLALALGLPAETTYFFGIIFSIIGMILVEKYRRSHIFFVTDYRIVTEVSFIDHKKNELGYDKINNLVLDQSLIARLFNFGTIIPVTASGLGMGSDIAMMTIGAGRSGAGGMYGGAVTGGRTVQTPRVRSMYGLWGVREPEDIQNMISEYIREYTEAPYLKKMTEHLADMRDDYPREPPRQDPRSLTPKDSTPHNNAPRPPDPPRQPPIQDQRAAMRPVQSVPPQQPVQRTPPQPPVQQSPSQPVQRTPPVQPPIQPEVPANPPVNKPPLDGVLSRETQPVKKSDGDEDDQTQE